MLSSYLMSAPAPLDTTGFVTLGKTLPHAQHVFGTRARTHPDSNATVRAYTERLGPIAHMRQVHGTRVVYAGSSGLYPECDALITDEPGLWLGVKTADCVPVLISGPGVCAAVHAGWRGLAAGIIPATVEELCILSALNPEDLHLAIGPCISQENYEVEDHFSAHFAKKFFRPAESKGRQLLDLPAVARTQALHVGLPESQIHTLGRCTYAEPDFFNSYRRHSHQPETDGPYAVQLSLIRLTPRG